MNLPIRFIGFVFGMLLLGLPSHAGDDAIKIAIPPDDLTQEERAPLQDYLSKELKRPVRFVVPGTYKDMIESLNSGSSDFALVGGLAYVQAHGKIGAIPLVQRAADKRFHAVFITGINSPIHSLSDLKGRTFAFGDVNSTSGHLMPYFELKEAGLNPERDLKFRYSGSHPVTAVMVESGVVEAGALDEAFYKSLVASGKVDGKKVRVFYTSKPFVDWVIVARKDVPLAEQESFSKALMSLRPGPDAKILKVLRADQFVKANDEEYTTLRQIAKELAMF